MTTVLLQKLYSKNLINPPRWLVDSTQYLVVMGSTAFGVSEDSSDVDLYGFCIPPKTIVFPHLAGEIRGFGRQTKQFENWLQHHIASPDGKDTTYDIQIFGIVRYFDLCLRCNPNIIDSIFVPRRCISHSTQIGELVRENRRLFLHKGAWSTYKGYCYSQMSKIRNKVNAKNPQRAESINKHGYDIKYAYHTVRLLNQIEQIMVEHDLDLERNREQLKAIRRGEWTLAQLEMYFASKERLLEEAYSRSTLPESPDEQKIKDVLMRCLEIYYGSIDNAVQREQSVAGLLDDLESVIQKYRR